MAASISKQDKRFYEFGDFRLDPVERLLLRRGEAVPLTPKAFDTLLVLVRNGGHVLAKQELLSLVWPDTFVEETTLSSNIYALRKALGDAPDGRPYIETVPKLGYRFEAPVAEWPVEEDSLIIERRRTARLIVQQDEETAALEPVVHRGWRLSTRAISGLALVLLILAATGAYLWTRGTPKQGAAAAPIRSIAVLPFKTIGGDDGDQYLGLGLTDALITRLGTLRAITVRPATAVQKFAGADRDALQAGRELGVESVLDGQVQRSGGRIRVTLQILSVKDGAQLWATTLDGDFNAIFSLQDSISSRVGQAITRTMTGREKDLLTTQHSGNPDAYMACLKGRYFWNKRTEDGFKQAIESFNNARQIDPNCALAYAGLADCYILGGLPPGYWDYDSKTLATKALELDDTLAEAHATLAYYEGAVDWNWEGAEQEFRRAIDINPGYATAHQWHAYNLASMGRLDEALEEINRAREIDPLSLIINTDVGHMLYLARQYDQAIATFKTSLEMDPGFSVAHRRLGEAYIQKGMYDEALAEFRNPATSSSGFEQMQRGYVYGRLGARGQAEKELAELDLVSKSSLDPGYYGRAVIYAGLGEKDRAFEYLDKAYRIRSAKMALVKVEPLLDSLRSDPRYAMLLAWMGLGSQVKTEPPRG